MSGSGKYIISGGLLIIFLGYLVGPDMSYGQVTDSTRVFLGSDISLDSLQRDTTKIIEDAALDIAQDRGLFIVTPDRQMQLRILGSVRYLVVYDDRDLSSKNSLNTYEIDVGDQSQRIPNYYNGLNQSRLGFEVTRKTGKGNFFVRLETDFAGVNGFRIRHAYGQYGRFLFGQTWSLFSNITSLPATVGFGGPVGSISVRTPQIRFTTRNVFFPGSIVTLGLEYFKPDIYVPDTIIAKSFQVIPDITARIEKSLKWGSIQLSGIVPILSGMSEEGEYVFRPGWGLSFSTVINSWAAGKWYFQGAGGQAITRFFNDLSGQGLDLLFNPETGKSHLPFAYGTYLTYEHYWTARIFSNITYGLLIFQKEDFTPDDTYYRGNNFCLNTFWSIVEGSRLGLEYIHAFRTNKDGTKGRANRVNLLFYYDF
jgi:hypothetical protein